MEHELVWCFLCFNCLFIKKSNIKTSLTKIVVTLYYRIYFSIRLNDQSGKCSVFSFSLSMCSMVKLELSKIKLYILSQTRLLNSHKFTIESILFLNSKVSWLGVKIDAKAIYESMPPYSTVLYMYSTKEQCIN